MDETAQRPRRRFALNFMSGAFAVALALLFVLVLRSIAVQIAPPPVPLAEPYLDTSTEALCMEAGGRWIIPVGSSKRPIDVTSEPLPHPYCQGPLAFEREREQLSEQSQQTSLFVFAIGGAIAVAASMLERRLKAVAPGLMLGGIVAFFIAGIHVWMLTPGIGRLITIIIIFLILTGVGLYTFRDRLERTR